MKDIITVREYARLTTSQVAENSLDRAHIPRSAFEWLCKLSQRYVTHHDPAVVVVEDSQVLKLDNYVGVLETPCGTRIEILAKTFSDSDRKEKSRSLLQRMIAAALDVKPRETSEASLLLFDAPLSEWVVAQFLAALEHLIKRGVRSDYLRVESAETFLRGQLDVVRQMRQTLGREHVFNIRHDIFGPDRPENRLIKLALERVAKVAQLPANWRLAQELRGLLHEVPASTDVEGDFRKWRMDRLMAHYQPVRPWCELILFRQMPFSQKGEWRGISMLFPMEKLFERYVEKAMRRDLVSDVRFRPQARSEFLCSYNRENMFQLRPDMLVERGEQRWIMDAKWKRLDRTDRTNNYGLGQADLYQLFAYGQRYLGGKGELALIYPKWERFEEPIAHAFDFSNDLRLWVLPFDLDANCLVHAELTSLPLLRTGVFDGHAAHVNSIEMFA